MRIVRLFLLFRAKKQGCGAGKFLAAPAPGFFLSGSGSCFIFGAAPAPGFFLKSGTGSKGAKTTGSYRLRLPSPALLLTNTRLALLRSIGQSTSWKWLKLSAIIPVEGLRLLKTNLDTNVKDDLADSSVLSI